MPRYMIQASHDPSPQGCLQMIDEFMKAGSHYLTHADWGCMAGEHTAWITVEADNDAQAQHMVPPVIRKTALLVKLNKFSPDEVRELHEKYG